MHVYLEYTKTVKKEKTLKKKQECGLFLIFQKNRKVEVADYKFNTNRPAASEDFSILNRNTDQNLHTTKTDAKY